MDFSEDVYRALEDIVRPENISQEPVVLDGYCFIWGNEMLFDGKKFSVRPPAVVLPGSVEEVQAIVRVCNRFGIKYRAHATGFEASALSSDEPFLPIDMRRMNRIIDIDQKNRIAVVEPYVSQNKLFCEAMKVGLRPLMIGAGPSASVLCAVAANFGSGPTNISTDFGGRNLLGVEWVLPDGDVILLGSLGDGKGWANADGPGPSLRGVVRGYSGANGGIGIFTKAATKLYPWYGPTKMTASGKAPHYLMKIPKNFADYVVLIPEKIGFADFWHLLYEESIAFSADTLPLDVLAMFNTGSNDELWELAQATPEALRGLNVVCAMVILDAISERELDYKKRCFEEVVEKAGVMIYEDPDEQSRSCVFNTGLTAQFEPRAAFRPSGSFMVSFTAEESADSTHGIVDRAFEEVLKPAQETGLILETSPVPMWATMYGDGTLHAEVILAYDPADPESCKKAAEVVATGDDKVVEWGVGINALEGGESYREGAIKAALPRSVDFVKYMKAIKRSFDPNFVADSTWYVSPIDYEK